ncbi:insulinase family protein [uncultured Aliiroseovarius sp.]|uniref:M16 family metallopeptidase n=1 Tax=uncultured Aliiroseovarius sp. TaxID=1658783 RepID=UPI002615EBD4|nr:insulinase family protein [uncultured Aliiroseovarius sp.]
MHVFKFFLSGLFILFGGTLHAQDVIPLTDKGGLHAAYVVPTDVRDRVDVQLIVLSGAHDDPEPSGTAHLTEHLAAFSADATVLRQPRERDIHATIHNVATVYTNSGTPDEVDKLMRLSRAVLDSPKLPDGFAESEIDILHRETLLRERQSSYRWLQRKALQNLYGSLRGRANNTIDDLPKLNLEAAYQFHKEHYVPSNVSLIISGNIAPDDAAELVAKYFKDTVHTAPPPDKPWLAQRPDPALRYVERIQSDRLMHDTVQLVKFVEFEGRTTSVDMQGAFFIATTILQNRLSKALYYDTNQFLKMEIDIYFSKAADLELSIIAELMPGVSLEDAHDTLNTTLAGLLKTPISPQEIKRARHQQIEGAQNVARRASGFLYFLLNVAADGFPPVSPSIFTHTLNATSDQDVIEFMTSIVSPAATSVILAEKAD